MNEQLRTETDAGVRDGGQAAGAARQISRARDAASGRGEGQTLGGGGQQGAPHQRGEHQAELERAPGQGV